MQICIQTLFFCPAMYLDISAFLRPAKTVTGRFACQPDAILVQSLNI